ncbi:GcrA family cell cycle regulator, partial [Paracoccus sanguinis]|uniref:GcrA family cell cycle regulator n=1 Tax=Paracoccus sanguinis TaxID=1545044 RepID=UPI00209F2E39
MSWTDDRVETLKRMWAEGQSASQIAKELGGVTRNAVIGKVHRLGLSNRTESDEATAAPAPRVRSCGSLAPARHVVRRLPGRALVAVHSPIPHQLGGLRAQQQVFDADVVVSLPRLPLIVPEGERPARP